MNNEKNDRNKHADTVVRNHIIYSMGASFVPVLIVDIFAVSAVQLDMIKQLCKVYDIDYNDTQGKAIVTALTSSTIARLGARSLLKLIPGIGSVIGGLTVSIFAGASTYALGEVFKKHFENGGTILDFDVERLKKAYREKFEKGKEVVKEMKKEEADSKKGGFKVSEDEVVEETVKETAEATSDAPSSDVITRLKELAELKNSGVITEEEFEAMKKKLIENF